MKLVKNLGLAAAALAMSATAMAAPNAAMLVAADYQSNPQEVEAAKFFTEVYGGTVIKASDAANFANYDAIWVNVDRVGAESGVEKLPADIYGASANLKSYLDNGGNLYLSKFATQLTTVLGLLPAEKAPGIFGSGAGAVGADYWALNPFLGWIFREGGPNAGEQGYYDRSGHAIYAGLTYGNPNNWDNGEGWKHIPLVGKVLREDHNCMWDLNLFGKGDKADVIANFEAEHNCLVLATWGHVQDHCVAGIVEFLPTATRKGTAIVNGLGAYTWVESTDEYRPNVEKLTANTLNYLAPEGQGSGVAEVAVSEGEAVYYNFQGVKVANPEKGLYIKVVGGKATKVVL